MASSVIGDTAELTRTTIVAKATHRVVGQTGAFHFRLHDAPGVSKYFESHAKVSVQGVAKLSVSGPTSSTVSTSVTAAVVPDKYSSWPSTEEQVVQLQGSARVQHSLLVPPSSVPLIFGNEVADLFKPKSLVGYPPVVVGHFTVAGGSAASAVIVVVELTLSLDGVAHHKTW